MKNTSPLVTVITAAYQNYDGFENTVKSVLTQDYPRIEYIIADDGSPSFSMDFLEKIVNKYKSDNVETVKIIDNKENQGTVKNLNGAVKVAHGDYYILLDADDMFYNKTVLSAIVERMTSTKADLLTYSRMACSEDGKVIRMMPYKAFYKKLSELNTPEKQYKALVTSKYYELASGSAMCISKKLMEVNKGFDEKYKYWEDGPFFANSNLKGYKLDTAFDIIGIYYKLGGISNSKKKTKLQIGLANDAVNFYENVLNDKTFDLSTYERRRIIYSIKKIESPNTKNILLMVQYIDVVIGNQLMKLNYKCASRYPDEEK